ncbi:MAG: MazG family protein, partial [Actinomycetota bacterium]|nr:MazG family protein [Actinomycetota bacterium]
PDLLTVETRAAIGRLPRRFLRTARHPAAVAVPGAASFDGVYDAAATVEEVYPTIVERLVEAAGAEGEVLYAVPGSPRVGEASVVLLEADSRVEVDVLPALSFLDLVWSRLGADPLAAGVRLVDGCRFATDAAGERGPLLVAQADGPEVLSAVKLAVGAADPEARVTVLQRLGLSDEAVVEVPWAELDRSVAPDHLTCLYLPRLAEPVAGEVATFAELVRTLRDRCPWDRQQTHASLTRHLLEETYEVLEAIGSLAEPGGYEHLEEELGDLLFQVVFHATLAAEAGQFALADVARTVHDKLVRRHPHVFADVAVDGTDDVVRNWEQIKKEEKGRRSVMDGIPSTLPSILYALKVQRKAASLGLDASGAGTGTREAAVAGAAEGIGEALFALVAEARRLEVDPEAALRATADRVRRQVMAAEGG